MILAPNIVPEETLDYDEIFRRGGANCGDEDFTLCKCPHCGRIYLIECEVDTLYLDPDNLDRRLGINIGVSGFKCENCSGAFPEHVSWFGDELLTTMKVTWQDLEASPWHWITARTR